MEESWGEGEGGEEQGVEARGGCVVGCEGGDEVFLVWLWGLVVEFDRLRW